MLSRNELIAQLRGRRRSVEAEIKRIQEETLIDDTRAASNSGYLTALEVERAFLAGILAQQTIIGLDVNVEILRQLGSVRRAHDSHRIYFTSLTDWYGLRIERLPKKGSIISVYLRGEAISLSEGKAVVARLQNGKLYYDLDDRAFHGVGLAAEDFVFIVEQIQVAAREAKA